MTTDGNGWQRMTTDDAAGHVPTSPYAQGSQPHVTELLSDRLRLRSHRRSRGFKSLHLHHHKVPGQRVLLTVLRTDTLGGYMDLGLNVGRLVETTPAHLSPRSRPVPSRSPTEI